MNINIYGGRGRTPKTSHGFISSSKCLKKWLFLHKLGDKKEGDIVTIIIFPHCKYLLRVSQKDQKTP